MLALQSLTLSNVTKAEEADRYIKHFQAFHTPSPGAMIFKRSMIWRSLVVLATLQARHLMHVQMGTAIDSATKREGIRRATLINLLSP